MNGEGDNPVFRDGGISYIQIPAQDPAAAARFYAAAFAWQVSGPPRAPRFEDGTGHVIGKFVPGRSAPGDDGVRPFVYVDNLDATLARIAANGGEMVTDPYPEGDLRVAVFRDPEGNAVGVWQHDPREIGTG